MKLIQDMEIDTQELIKGELAKVFNSHVKEIINNFLNEDLESIKNALDISENCQDEELEPIIFILNEIKQLKEIKNRKIESEEWINLAINILNVKKIIIIGTTTNDANKTIS